MLGIIVSLPHELKSLTNKKIKAGTAYPVRTDLLVSLSGIGAERAYGAAQTLLAHGATALLGWGCAAALDEELTAGSLILPKTIISAKGENFPVTVEWHQRLHQSLAGRGVVHTDPLVETDAVLKTSAEKRALRERTGAAATDMESAAQARLAAESGLPFLALRAIVDTVSTAIPAKLLEAVHPTGSIDPLRLLTGAVLRPADWIKIARLGLQFHAAHKALRNTRDLVLESSL